MDDMDDHKHGSLLIKLKKTVEGLLAGHSAQGVWSTYGGLKRVCLDTEAILCHGLKTSQAGSDSDGGFWNFIQGLKWLCPSMATIINKLTKRKSQGQTIAQSGRDWLQESVQEHSFVKQLEVLIGHKEHLHTFYHGHAFLCQADYVDAMKICFKAIELNKPALLSDIDPQLLKQPSSTPSPCTKPQLHHQHSLPQRALRQGSLHLTPLDGSSLRAAHTTVDAARRRETFHRVSSFGGMGSKHSQLLEVNYPTINGSNLSLAVDPSIGVTSATSTRPFKSLSEPKAILTPSGFIHSPPSVSSSSSSSSFVSSSTSSSSSSSATAASTLLVPPPTTGASDGGRLGGDDLRGGEGGEIDGGVGIEGGDWGDNDNVSSPLGKSERLEAGKDSSEYRSLTSSSGGSDEKSGSQPNLTSVTSSDPNGLLVYDDIIVDATTSSSASPRECDVIIPDQEDRMGSDSRLLSPNADHDVVDDEDFNKDVLICGRGVVRKEDRKIGGRDDEGGGGDGAAGICERTRLEEVPKGVSNSECVAAPTSSSSIRSDVALDNNNDKDNKDDIVNSQFSSCAAFCDNQNVQSVSNTNYSKSSSSQNMQPYCDNDNNDNNNDNEIQSRRGGYDALEFKSKQMCNTNEGDLVDGVSKTVSPADKSFNEDVDIKCAISTKITSSNQSACIENTGKVAIGSDKGSGPHQHNSSSSSYSAEAAAASSSPSFSSSYTAAGDNNSSSSCVDANHTFQQEQPPPNHQHGAPNPLTTNTITHTTSTITHPRSSPIINSYTNSKTPPSSQNNQQEEEKTCHENNTNTHPSQTRSSTHHHQNNTRSPRPRQPTTISLSTSAPTTSILSSTSRPPHSTYHQHHHHHHEQPNIDDAPIDDPLAAPLHSPPSPQPPRPKTSSTLSSSSSTTTATTTSNYDEEAEGREASLNNPGLKFQTSGSNPKLSSSSSSTGQIYTPPSFPFRAGSLERGSNLSPSDAAPTPRSTVQHKHGHKRWVSDTSTIQVQRSTSVTPHTSQGKGANSGTTSRQSSIGSSLGYQYGTLTRPQEGQSLINYLVSQDFKTCANMEKENAHFHISETLIAAFESMQWNQTVKKEEEDMRNAASAARRSSSTSSSSSSDEEIQELRQRIRIRKREKMMERGHSFPSVSDDTEEGTLPGMSPPGSVTPQGMGSEEDEDRKEFDVDLSTADDSLVDAIQSSASGGHGETTPATNLQAMASKGLNLSMASLYSETELMRSNQQARQKSISQQEEASLIAGSAESVAISLLKKFSEKSLPKASELKWLVSECDAPQRVSNMKSKWLECGRDAPRMLLPLPASIPVSPDDADNTPTAAQTRLRGNLEWAPPRAQIIFSIHPSEKRSAVLARQNHRCAGCGTRVDPAYAKRYRYCEYLGKYFCQCCHGGETSVIPGRVIERWDFTRYPISNFSFHLLEKMWLEPLFHIDNVNPNLYRRVRGLEAIRDGRQQLTHLHALLRVCKRDSKLLGHIQNLPPHWIESDNVYSMEDFTLVKTSQMQTTVKALVASARQHVAECQLCQGLGFICGLCKDTRVIFPFQLNAVVKCPVCQSCYHKKCFVVGKCPKCIRIEARRKQQQQPLSPMSPESSPEWNGGSKSNQKDEGNRDTCNTNGTEISGNLNNTLGDDDDVSDAAKRRVNVDGEVEEEDEEEMLTVVVQEQEVEQEEPTGDTLEVTDTKVEVVDDNKIPISNDTDPDIEEGSQNPSPGVGL